MKRMTPDLEELLYEVSSRWTMCGLEPKPLNKSLVGHFISRAYRKCNLPAPEIYYASSPLASQAIACELKVRSRHWHMPSMLDRMNLEEQIFFLPKVGRQVRETVWLSGRRVYFVKRGVETQMRRFLEQMFEPFFDDYRIVQACLFYDFFRLAGVLGEKIGGIDDLFRYVAEGGVFMTLCEASNVIVCPNPTTVHFDVNGDLHNETGPALSWDDGFCLRFIHGKAQEVPETVLTSSPPGHRYELLRLLRERTSGVRRDFLTHHHTDIFSHGLMARIIDEWDTPWGVYDLISIESPKIDGSLVYLKMVNPSTGEWHLECVPPVTTCEEALAWRDGESSYTMPAILT